MPNDEITSDKLELIEHLQILRASILRSIISLLMASGISWIFREKLAWLFTNPVKKYAQAHQIELVAFKLTDVLTIHLQIAFWAGLLLSFPYIMFEFWKFVSPGLYPNERKMLAVASFFGSIFFMLGVLFAYLYVVPTAIDFLAEYSQSSSFGVKLWISLPKHISFIVSLMLGFGIIAEVPLIMVVLSILGIINPKWYSKHRGTALIILAVLSALLTPPDALSMILMLVPMYALYEIAIWVSILFSRGHN